MRKMDLATLHEVAPMRKPGYLAAVHARGRVAGAAIILSDEDYEALRREYQLPVIVEGKQRPNLPGAKRFEICRSCGQSTEDGFGCVHHKGCCFGRWRSQPANKCPEGKW